MATRLTFTFFGEAQIDRTLELVQDRAEDASPVWHALADRFVEAEQRQFASEGGFGSGRWAPLSPVYAAWKAKAFPGRGILVRTGDLMRRLTDGPEVRHISPRAMVVGATDPDGVGGFHQRGTDRMPRRRPVEFPESERAAWAKAVHRFIVTGEATV